MNYSSDTYNEAAELTGYIWRNCRHLMNDDERLADHAFTVEIKMDDPHLFGGNDNRTNPRLDRERKRYMWNPYVQQALRLGIEGYRAFRATVRDRVLRDNPDPTLIHRCPQCRRVLPTPKARQCLWCGADWHDV